MEVITDNDLSDNHVVFETVTAQYNVYEPRSLRESSISPYIHTILAARLGNIEKAYNLFLHATRLDLDDYNNELAEGLHITSMPGSWLAIVQGFAGMQIENDVLSFNPVIPQKWESYAFYLNFRGRLLQVKIQKKQIVINLLEGNSLNISILKTVYSLSNDKGLTIN